MNPVTNALTQGFSHSNILQYLLRHFPHARKKIESALAKGFSAEKIVEFLQGGRKEVNKPITEHEKTRFSDKEKQKNLEKGVVKGGLALGTAALGGYALSRALPRAATALQGQLLPALPTTPQLPGGARLALPASGQAAIQTPPPVQPQGPLPYSNPTAQGMRPPRSIQPNQPPIAPVPEPTQIQSSTVPIRETIPLPQSLQKQTSALLSAGNNPQTIAATLKSTQPKIVKEYEKATNQSIENAVDDFAKQNIGEPQANIGSDLEERTQEPIIPVQQSADNEIVRPIEKEKPNELSKGSTVALHNGDIGEIIDIRKGVATVNAQGKEYRRKISDLIESPLPEKDLADLFEDLTKKIEIKSGEEISRMVNWAGYDPKTNELAFVPHLGALYVYDNISPEDATELTNILSTRKTTGENFIGVWKQGSKSPIGASMSKLIQRLQAERGGKGSEYKSKFEKIYDALELPKIEAKAKHEEQKKALKSIKEKKDVKKRKAKKPGTS